MKNNPLSDLYISHGMVIQGDPTSVATLTRGIRITGLALENASNLHCSSVEHSLRSLLQCVPSEFSIQVRFTNSGDYNAELQNYFHTTEAKAGRWSKEQRNFRFSRIHQQFDLGNISRQEVRFFISRKIAHQGERANGLKESKISALLTAESASFDGVFQQLSHAMEIVGGRAELLDNEELFLEFDKALNPSINPYDPRLALERFHPDRSIIENCVHSDMVVTKEPDCGFHFDGNCHAIILLKSLPGLTTCGGILQISSGLPIRNFEITVLAGQLDLESEIQQEEDKAAKLVRALASSSKMRFRMALQKSRERIDRLAFGETKPCRVQVILHCWDADFNRLRNETLAVLKSAILRFQGAQYYDVGQAVMARNYFLSSLPGSPFKENAFIHRTEEVTVANLLPVSSNHDGTLDNAEAIYQTANNGIFGISLFKDKDGTPFTNHGLITGKTGYGKSSTTLDLLTQLQPHLDHVFIIEDGNSYGSWVQTYEDQANSFFIDPNGEDVLNYFDTGGIPLTPQHASDVAAVHMLMTGRSESEDVNTSRVGKLKELARGFYLDHQKDWRLRNPERFRQVCRDHAAMIRFGEERQLRDSGILFSDFIHWKSSDQAGHAQMLASLPAQIPENGEDLFRFSFAYIDSSEMPTHSGFCDWLEAKEATTGELDRIRTNLNAWRADRGCGLFDGISTFSFNGKVVHIELGLISETDTQLKGLAALIASNYIRNTITGMDREKTKLVLFEELGRFLSFDNAENIVADFYERGRKYSTCVLTVIQQITKIPEALKNSILGNSSFGMFFRQGDSNNADALQKAFRLPESTTLSLMRLEKPSRESGAHFICWQVGNDGSVIHAGRNVVSPEMLYIADSSGAGYEERKKALVQYSDIIEGIKTECRKNPPGVS
jgi:hypothetical protein